MPNQQFNWQFDEEGAWAPVDPADPAAPRRRRIDRRALAVAGLVVGMVLAVGGAAVWQRYQSNTAAMRRDVRRAMVQEASAWAGGDQAGFEAVLDPSADSGWRTLMQRTFQFGPRLGTQSILSREGTVQQIDVRGNIAMVRVLIPAAQPGETAYQETRFYRNTGDAWLRTAPDTAWWGLVTEDLKTAHFDFVYHPRDRAAVQAAAASVEDFYSRVRSDLGSKGAAPDGLTIQVEPQAGFPGGRFGGYRPISARVTVPAPGLTLEPAGTPPGDALKSSIAGLIFGRALSEAGIAGPAYGAGRSYLDGIRQWEVWQWTGGPAPWEDPAQLAALREARAGGDPLLGSLTIGQAAPRSGALGRYGPNDGTTGRYGPLDGPTAGGGFGDRFIPRPAAALLVDYIATTYGRERLGSLLQAGAGGVSLPELVQGTLGVSVDQFQAGWLAHVDRVLEPGQPTAQR